MLYISIDRSTIGNVVFLGYSCMHGMIGEQLLLTCIKVSFQCHFVQTYIHKFERTGCIWMLHVSNNYSTTGDIPFMFTSCMSDLTGKLWLQIFITVILSDNPMCIPQAKVETQLHLQIYYTPIHSIATQKNSSRVKSSKAVIVSKHLTCIYISIWCATTHATKLT